MSGDLSGNGSFTSTGGDFSLSGAGNGGSFTTTTSGGAGLNGSGSFTTTGDATVQT